MNVLYSFQNDITPCDTLLNLNNGNIWHFMDLRVTIHEIVDCRFEDLYVDVDFGQIFVVDCRQMSKNVVESTKSRTPPGPPPSTLDWNIGK